MSHFYYSEKHHKLIDEAVRYGLSIGLRTERTDRGAAEAAINELYTSVGRPAPEKILWFESPYASVKALADEHEKARWGYHTSIWHELIGNFDSLKASAIPQHDPRVPDDIRHIKLDLSSRIDMEVWHWVGSELAKNLRKRTRAPVNAVSSHIGAHFNARHAAEIFALEKLGKAIEPRFASFRSVTELLWWWHPGERNVYASEPPTVIHRDNKPRQPRLHRSKGKALQFADGAGITAWRGQVIPDGWLAGKPPTPEQAVNRRDDAERAIACEIIGWNRVFEALRSKQVDVIEIPTRATLRAIHTGTNPSGRFLDFVDRQGRRHLMPVDASVSSVAEAKAKLGIS